MKEPATKLKGEKREDICFLTRKTQFTERIKFSFLIRTLLVLSSMQQHGKEITGKMIHKPTLMLSNNHNRQSVTKGAIVQVSISSF